MDLKEMQAHHDRVMVEHFHQTAERLNDERLTEAANALVGVLTDDNMLPATVAVTGLWMMGIQLAASIGQPDQSIKDIFGMLVNWLDAHKPAQVHEAQRVADQEADQMAKAALGGRGDN